MKNNNVEYLVCLWCDKKMYLEDDVYIFEDETFCCEDCLLNHMSTYGDVILKSIDEYVLEEYWYEENEE